MDKISGIIPGSARVMSVDLKEASAIRPGTPSFGRPEGISALKENAREQGLATAQKAVNVQQEMNDWRDRDTKHAAVVNELSDKFFIRNQRAAEPVIRESFNNPAAVNAMSASTTSRPAGFKTDSVGSFRAGGGFTNESALFEDDGDALELPTLSQPEGLFPKGSFVDRSA